MQLWLGICCLQLSQWHVCGNVNTCFLLWVLTESIQHCWFNLVRQNATAQKSWACFLLSDKLTGLACGDTPQEVNVHTAKETAAKHFMQALALRCVYMINPSVNSSVDTALVYKAEPHVWKILKMNAWRTTVTHIFGLLEAGPWGVRSSTLFRCGGGESGEVLWRHWGSFLSLSVDSWDDPQVGWEEHFRESRAVGREVQGQNKITVAGGNYLLLWGSFCRVGRARGECCKSHLPF